MANDGDEVDPNEVVTQVGSVSRRLRGNIRLERTFSFRSGLRADRGETYMSVIAGRISLSEAVRMVHTGDDAGSADAVRYAQVKDLKSEGFTVIHKPSRRIPEHVAVFGPEPWDTEVLRKFDECFSEYVTGQ
jgi:hypothetical protein